MLIGYMRVSSENDRQAFDLQYDVLIKAGIDPRHISRTKPAVRGITAKGYKKHSDI